MTDCDMIFWKWLKLYLEELEFLDTKIPLVRFRRKFNTEEYAQKTPEELRKIFESNEEEHKEFIKYVRKILPK